MSQLRVQTAASGYTSLVGPAIDSIASTFTNPDDSQPKHAPHITLLTKAEAQELQDRALPNPFVDVQFEEDNMVTLGKGGGGGSQFIVVLLNRANILRLKVGLKLKFFHVTLTDPPSQEAETYYQDLLLLSLDRLSLPETPIRDVEALSHHHFLRQEYSSSIEVALLGLRRFPSSSQPFLRIAESSFRLEHFKLAMVAFARAYDLSHSSNFKLRRYCLKHIGRCSRRTDWGPTYLESEKPQFDGLQLNDKAQLLQPWSKSLWKGCLELCEDLEVPELSVASRERSFVHSSRQREYGLPRFFRWIVPYRLAVSSTPRNEIDIEELASPSIGIKHILTLTAESPLPSAWFDKTRHLLTNTFLPIQDQRSPSVEQIQLFLRIASDLDECPLLVHCGGGKGRAGVMVASYLLAFGFKSASPVWRYPAFSPSQAIEILRKIRPGSIETVEQEDGIKRFSKQMSKDGRPFPPLIAEPTDLEPVLEGKLEGLDLIVLVGLPASGKSSFRKALVARDKTWRFISSDENGGKSAVLKAVSTFRPGDKLIVDRCNATVEARKDLLRLAQHSKKPVAVYFSASSELCLQRAQLRPDHPVLSPGGRVRAAIKQFSNQLVRPSLAEGFSAVVNVPSIRASLDLVQQLAQPLTLLKFPRTAHLLDLGSATRDDLVATSLVLRPSQEIVITEKVDGANLGFSLDCDRRIVIQNRSHYVDTTTHAQFKKLNLWLDSHRLELQRILGQDNSFPERYILYGEWMAAKHRTSTVPETENLLAMLQEVSLFSTSQRREGIYLKIETEQQVVERLKIVRGDFIAGNEHWTKSRIEFNKVVAKE
ncbi:hypothetical protein JCM3765_004556 [Sporobolomyces pararoseus]